jgi:hypothetical protein
MRDGSLTTSKPVLAANRGSASALWDLAGFHVGADSNLAEDQP